MKKVIYDSTASQYCVSDVTDELLRLVRHCAASGYDIVITNNIPDEPNKRGAVLVRCPQCRKAYWGFLDDECCPECKTPKVERCEIFPRDGTTGVELHYIFRPSARELFSISKAIDNPYFAGFEFEDGEVRVSPWIRHDKPFRSFEHAKYVLFRRGE